MTLPTYGGHMAIIKKDEAEEIRRRREKECFPIINRGKLWYAHLTIEQYNQLNDWYHKWLDAPETKIIPPFPSWIDGKLQREEILY